MASVFSGLINWFWGFTQRTRTLPTEQVTLRRNRIYILPTRHGLLFTLILFVMLLGSINYNNSMGYMLTFFLGSMMMVSILHTHRMLLGLTVKKGKAPPVFVGDNVNFQLWIDNHHQFARYALHWQLGRQARMDPQRQITIIDVAANEQQSFNVTLLAEKRGKMTLSPLTVSSRFPLGLFYVWAYVEFNFTTLVYPAPRGQQTLPQGGQTRENQGEGSPTTGGGEDFIGYREYKIGDSPRHIDWKAVARGQGWLVKQFGGRSLTRLWFRWEDVSHLSVEAALSQLCLWVLLADAQGAQYGLILPQQTIERNSGDQHREACLTALALFGLPQEKSA